MILDELMELSNGACIVIPRCKQCGRLLPRKWERDEIIEDGDNWYGPKLKMFWTCKKCGAEYTDTVGI